MGFGFNVGLNLLLKNVILLLALTSTVILKRLECVCLFFYKLSLSLSLSVRFFMRFSIMNVWFVCVFFFMTKFAPPFQHDCFQAPCLNFASLAARKRLSNAIKSCANLSDAHKSNGRFYRACPHALTNHQRTNHPTKKDRKEIKTLDACPYLDFTAPAQNHQRWIRLCA